MCYTHANIGKAPELNFARQAAKLAAAKEES
jgi:hypothetical protein